MESLNKTYDMNVENAFIIRIKDNTVSEELAERCANSCKNVGMPYKFWDAYDGISAPIKEPEHLKNHVLMRMMKLSDPYMLRGEVACALSHISLWSLCLEIEKPIVILEHDAMMVKPYLKHMVFNSICYLGCAEQVVSKMGVFPTPPHGSESHNYHFMCRAHAYAIDPAIARNLTSYVLKYGIASSLDTMIRADVFPMHQTGIFAYDATEGASTILNRPPNGRPCVRNEDLSN